MSKITPGPWILGNERLRGGLYWVVMRGENLETIDLHDDENGENDARAIAALPELTEAVEKTIADIRLFSNAFDDGSASKDFCIGIENRLRSALLNTKSSE